MEQNITGAHLLTLDSKQFKQLGLDGDDKVKVGQGHARGGDILLGLQLH